MIGSVVLGCTPASTPTTTPTPLVTPPPVPADVKPWPDIAWMPARGVGGAGPADAEQVVAVGYRENGPIRDGLIWHSPDGEAWTRVDAPGAFDAVDLVDVAPAPGGFVALGIGTAGAADERPNAVFYRSPDGRSWARLGQMAGSADTYPASVTGGVDGVVAAGSDADGDAVLWHSFDGRTFERIAARGPAEGAVIDPHAVVDGYVALGSTSERPVLLRSSDAETWIASAIDAAPDVVAARLTPGRWGYVVQGLWAPGCSPMAACAGQAIAWWSADGSGWGRLPAEASPVANGASLIVPAGDHGLLAIDGASAWASPDGWTWRPLPEPSDGSMSVNDAVVWGDVIVAVGARFDENGASHAAMVIAR